MGRTVTRQDTTRGDANSLVQSDRQLIDRCLAGEEDAWRELFTQRHPGLVRVSRSFLGHSRGDSQLAEEIAARVWLALLRDSGKALARFDPAQDRDFGTFLSGVARHEVLRYCRSERRRRLRETIAAQTASPSTKANSADISLLLREFMATLVPKEVGFMEEFLLSRSLVNGQGSKEELSQANVWQRKHRLRTKLLAYLNGSK